MAHQRALHVIVVVGGGVCGVNIGILALLAHEEPDQEAKYGYSCDTAYYAADDWSQGCTGTAGGVVVIATVAIAVAIAIVITIGVYRHDNGCNTRLL